MSFRDRLRAASYRGVRFFVDEDSLVAAKRVQVHEYPGRDGGYVEELGKGLQRWQVTAHLIGDDVFVQRERLVDALLAPGAATLVLPSRGEHRAVCTEIGRNTESITGEGRISSFDLVFVEAGENLFPGVVTDTRDRLRQAIERALEVLRETFENRFGLPKAPQWLADDAAARVQEIADALDQAAAIVAAPAAAQAELARKARRLRSGALGLVRQPADLGQDLVEIYAGVAALDVDARARAGALERLRAAVPDPGALPLTTPSRITLARNAAALAAMHRRAALLVLLDVGGELEFASAQDAAEHRVHVAELVVDEMTRAGDAGEDADYAALADALAEAVQDLDTRAARLPTRRLLELDQTTPALVLAYRLHGDAARDAEIIARNAVRRPGFVPGGTRVEYLAGP